LILSRNPHPQKVWKTLTETYSEGARLGNTTLDLYSDGAHLGNTTLDLYSKGGRFESQPGHHYPD